ncbi:MAG: site-specific integrase, partial [Holophagaceae bacterium]|nr:site-specific integrase [Holophagaceae bacterium]
MPQRKQSPDLQHRTNRLKIKPGKGGNVNIAPGLNLRYRRGVRKNSWLGTYENLDATDGKRKAFYSQTWLADDYEDANGDNILDYRQAYDKVMEWGKKIEKQIRLEKLGVEFKDVSTYTVTDAMNDWLKRKKATGCTPKNLRDYQYSINRWITNSQIGNIPVADLVARKIEQWYEWLCNQPRQGYGYDCPPPQTPEEKGARRRTATRVLKGLLNPALNYAVKINDSLAQECSPYQWNRLVISPEPSKARDVVIPKEDFRKMLRVARHDFKQLLIGAYLTALRHSELRMAQTKHFKNGVLFIPKENTKSGKDFSVNFDPAGKAFFQNLIAGKQPHDHIFVKLDGTPWSLHSQTKLMTQVCEAAGLLTETERKKYNFHDIRRSRITDNAAAGVDMEINSRNVGHSSSAVTKKHYTVVENTRISDELERKVGESDWELIQDATLPKIQPFKV